MHRWLPVLVVFTLLAAPAFAAKNPSLVHLETTLKADMIKTFKTQSPNLKITTVTCTLPKTDSVKTHCKAYFVVRTVKGYYPVTTTFIDLGGKLHWSAQAAKCFDTKLKKYLPC